MSDGIKVVKSFELILGNHRIKAEDDDYRFIELIDQGLRTLVQIKQVINKHTRDTDGGEIYAFGDFLTRGYQVLVCTEFRVHVKIKGETAMPDIRTKAPTLLAVYDEEGVEVKDQEIIDLIALDLETDQSFAIEFHSEIRRQTGRTSRFVKTLKPGQVVVAPTESFKTLLSEMIAAAGKDNEVIVLSLSELIKRTADKLTEDRRFPHDFYEYNRHHTVLVDR